jgi:Cu/Ag efflux pump CusA
MRARQVASERMTQVFMLPHVSKPPVMINPVSSASRCMAIGLTSDKLSLIDMSVLARWTILPRLMGVPGVANVSLWGERKWQVQVQVDPDRLRDKKITLSQIIKTTGNALWSSPLTYLEASTPGSGGWIDTPNQRLGIRHILPIKEAKDLAQISIDGASTVRLGDVANVVEAHQPLIGDAIVKDAPGLMLVVEKFPWANTEDVTEEVDEALAALRPGLAGVDLDPTLFRPATFLELAADNLASALLLGAGLLFLAFFVFLASWRAALIGSVAILASLFAAGAVLYIRGVTLNLVILAGLLIGLGAIIDDAIVDMETIVRRLGQARREGRGQSAANVIREAAFETRRPLLYATVVLLLGAVPVLFLGGVTGSFSQPLAFAYLLAILTSLLVAVTVTPALSLLLLRDVAPSPTASHTTRLVGGVYPRVSGWLAATPARAMLVAGVVMVAGLASLPLLRQETLLPSFKETDLVVRLEGSSSASHPAMSRIMTLASRELRAIPGVRNVSANVGRAITSDRRTNINSGELWVSLDPEADYDTTVATVKRAVAGYPGLSPEVLTYLQAKFREELSGTDESLVVRVYGEDLELLGKKADEVQKVLAKITGVTDARVRSPKQMPTLEVEVDIEKAKQYGLKPGDVRRAATSLVSGIEVGSLFEEQKVFDVMVVGAPQARHSLTSVEELAIDTPAGGVVRLKDVAKIRIAPGATAIQRDAVARCIDVTASVRGRDLAAVAAAVKSGIDQIDFPLEYRAELLGEFAERLATQQRVLALAIAAGLGAFLILQAFFGSWRLAMAVFVALPMALAGCVLAVSAGGGVLSMGSILGFAAVLVMAVRNAVMLVTRYRQLERNEGHSFGAELVKLGTEERAAPVLMSALAMALAFLPAALFGNKAGLEILNPMAIVVLGGVITTTLFTLVGVPTFYLLFGGASEPDLDLVEYVPNALVAE